jgi:3'-phosphoadenosine 5'-phosphosulfate sulfotransferase (PAPS reductase)/FAD synthetase
MMNAAVIPNLAAYDIILINTSGGKDSQTMLRKVVRASEQAGVKDRVVAVHCDLGRAEWAGTRELAEEQVQHYSVRFEVVRRPQGDLVDQIAARGMFPSSTARYCTSDQKRGQVYTLMTRLVREVQAVKGKDHQVRILNCMGLRADESPARKKKLAFKHDVMASNQKRHVDTWLAIHDWTLAEVWADIRASGVRYHRAYDLGMPRLSCCFCVLASKDALLLAGEHNSELLQTYVNLEKKMNHTLQLVKLNKKGEVKGVSAQMIQADLAAGKRADPANIKTWCM